MVIKYINIYLQDVICFFVAALIQNMWSVFIQLGSDCLTGTANKGQTTGVQVQFIYNVVTSTTKQNILM